MTPATPEIKRLEPAHDILHQTRKHPLDPICAPKSIAVIGATENANTRRADGFSKPRPRRI